MNTSEYSDAQLLWKMFYAGECFRKARGAAQHIFDAKLEHDSPIFSPLVTAIYVLYAKPFTRADAVGKLGEEIIPVEHRELHGLLLEHRHQVYAHRDAYGFTVADYGPVNQVRAIVQPQEIRLLATDFHAQFPAMPSIINLCQALEKKTDYHVDKLWTRHKKAIPNMVGQYMLNVRDLSADMWIRQKPMVLTRGS
jgi:hypothetical protein